MIRRYKKNLLLGLFLAVFTVGSAGLTGCASYQQKIDASRRLIRERQFQAAADLLKPLAEKPSDDQLVYLFEYGTALQLAGQYAESTKVFLQADDLAVLKDYHSVSRIAGSLVFNEGMVQYKGEDYEKVLINAMLAINYLVQNNLDDALVETKRINQKLDYFITEGKKSYQQNEFAYYLSGCIWEANREWDSAFIDYSKVTKLRPDLSFVWEDVLRTALAARRMGDVEQIKKDHPEIQALPEWKNVNYGEIIFIFQQGWGPRKYERPEAPRFPKLYPTASNTTRARMLISDKAPILTQTIYDLSKVAIKTLEDDYGRLVAKRVAGLATKATIANQLDRKNNGLGQLAWIAMNVSDRADLRQWSNLPETLQMARIFLPAGHYKVHVEGLANSGTLSGETSPEWDIEVKPRQKTFLNWRSLN